MKKLNNKLLIIAAIGVVPLVVAGLYLYRSNQNNNPKSLDETCLGINAKPGNPGYQPECNE